MSEAGGSGASGGFDEATAVKSVGDGAASAAANVTAGVGRYEAQIVDRYSIGPVPNGGYLMSLVQRAISERLPGRTPLTLTTHFLRPALIAPARVDVEVLKEGKRYATVRARLWQGEQEVVSSIATVGGAAAAAGAGASAAGPSAAGPSAAPAAPPSWINGAPPELPPIDQLVPVPSNEFFRIGYQFDLRLDPAVAGWITGNPPGVAEMRGVIRFADGREPDLLSLPLFSDAVVPAIFGVVRPRHVPTLEMTVHFRSPPSPGWLRFRFTTRFAFGGHLDEDGELWDSTGQLVAQSRQLAVLSQP